MSARVPPTSWWKARSRAELGHAAEHGDRRPPARCSEMVERGAHRNGVRVVTVVDQVTPPSSSNQLAAQRAESHVERSFDWRRNRLRAGHRREQVARGSASSNDGSRTSPWGVAMRSRRPAPCRSGISGLAGSSSAGGRRRPRRRRRRHVVAQCGVSSGSPAGTTAVAPGARPPISSALAAATASTVPSSSKVHRPDVDDATDIGISDRRQLGDLAGAAHRHLEHQRPRCPPGRRGSSAAGRSRC